MDTDGSNGAASSPRLWWIAFGVFTLLGWVWAVASPLMASPDEPVHAMKAAAIVRGELIGRETIVRQTDPKVLNKVASQVDLPKAYADLPAAPACYAFRVEQPASCSPGIEDDESPSSGEVYVGRYPPISYLVLGLPTLVVDPEPALWVMRFLSAAVAAALLACAVTAVRDLDRRGACVIALVVALTPMVMFVASSINPTGWEVTAALAAWPSTLVLFRRAGRVRTGQAVRAAVTLSAFALARPLSPAFVAVLLVTVLAYAGTRENLRALWGQRVVRRAGYVTVAAGVIALAWVAGVKAYDSFSGFPLPGLSRGDIARHSIGELTFRGRQVIGIFGWLDTPLSPVIINLWWAAIAAVSLAGLALASWRGRAVIVASMLLAVALPTLAEEMSATNIGFAWQGRYSMPLALGILILCGDAVSRSGRIPRVALRTFGLAVVAFAGVAMFVALLTSVRRYAVGAANSLFAFLGDEATWTPVTGSGAFLVLAFAASAAYGVAAGTLVWQRTGAATDGSAAETPAADQTAEGLTTPRASSASTSSALTGGLQ